jgi:hypothetical protein
MDNGLRGTRTIPRNIKARSYLIRHVISMLASEPAPFYMECAQLEVTGDGAAEPGEEYLVSFPDAYHDGESESTSVDSELRH